MVPDIKEAKELYNGKFEKYVKTGEETIHMRRIFEKINEFLGDIKNKIFCRLQISLRICLLYSIRCQSYWS